MVRAILALLGVLILVTQLAAATWTSNNFFYKPNLGARGAEEKAKFDSGLDRVDTRLGNEKWLNDPAYGGNLRTAVGALVNTPTVLSIPPGTWAISEDLIVPANITLKPIHGAVLSLTPAATLTINGNLEAGPYQVFSCTGTGKVVFGTGSIKEVLPQWWYNGGGDWGPALQKAADSVAEVGRGSDGGVAHNSGGVIRLLPGAYAWSSPVTLYQAMSVLGAGMESTRCDYSGTGPAFRFAATPNPVTATSTAPKFKGFTLACMTSGGCGIKLNDPKIDQLNDHTTIQLYATIEDIEFRGTYATGTYAIQLNLCFSSSIRNCHFSQFDRQIDLHNCDEPVVEGCRFMGGNMQLAVNAGFPVENLSSENPCKVTWTAHGMQTGDMISLYALKGTGWSGLSGFGPSAITRVDDDHFTINYNTSTFSAYSPATNGGLITYNYFTGGKGRYLHNSFMMPHTGGLAFIVCGDGSPTIHDNYFENYTSNGTTDYIIKFLGGKAIRVMDNRLMVGTGATTLGSFDFSEVSWSLGAASYLQITGNNSATADNYDLLPCVFPYQNNYYFYYLTDAMGGYRRKIIHHGNAQAIDDSFPYNSLDKQTWQGNTAFVGSPDLPGLINTGAATTTRIPSDQHPGGGVFRMPANATKNNSLLSWTSTGVNGTVSVYIEAKASTAGQKVKVEYLNGGTSGAIVEQALTTSWAWYKVHNGVAATDLGLNVWNEDTGTNGNVYLRRVVAMYN